jgi:hypothetical protein
MTTRGLWLSLVLGLLLTSASQAANNLGSLRVPEVIQEYLGTLVGAYVVEGCLPPVPTTSLTLAATACTAMVRTGTAPPRLVPVVQTATALGPLVSGDGAYWIAVHVDTSTAVAGWTRTAGGANRAGSHYLWRFGPTKPADPPDGLIVLKVTVTSGSITAVADLRIPASYVTKGVYDPRDPLYGGIVGGGDARAALQAAVDAIAAQAPSSVGILHIPAGLWGIDTPGLLLKSPIMIRGEGAATSLLVDLTPTGTMISTGGMADQTARVTIRDLALTASAVKTGGIAVLATTPAPSDVANQQLFVQNVWCVHHFTCLSLQNSTNAHIVDNQFDDMRGTGIIINTSYNPDAGDNSISGNVFSGGFGDTAILVQTSGQRITNNKFLAFQKAIVVDPSQATIGLVDVLIAENSIEAQAQYGVLLQTSLAGARVADVHIVNNQFSSLPTAPIFAAIGMSGQVGPFVINGNQITIQHDGKAIFLSDDTLLHRPSAYVITGNIIDGANRPTTIGIYVGSTLPTPIPRGVVSGNFVTGMASPYVGKDAMFFANNILPASQLMELGFDGSQVFCFDCTVNNAGDNTCVAGGDGALAVRIAGVYRCFKNQN